MFFIIKELPYDNLRFGFFFLFFTKIINLVVIMNASAVMANVPVLVAKKVSHVAVIAVVPVVKKSAVVVANSKPNFNSYILF